MKTTPFPPWCFCCWITIILLPFLGVWWVEWGWKHLSIYIEIMLFFSWCYQHILIDALDPKIILWVFKAIKNFTTLFHRKGLTEPKLLRKQTRKNSLQWIIKSPILFLSSRPNTTSICSRKKLFHPAICLTRNSFEDSVESFSLLEYFIDGFNNFCSRYIPQQSNCKITEHFLRK